MDFEEMKFTVVDDDGEDLECEVLFTFECDENGKNYIVYTDNSIDENGDVRVFASIYDPDEEETTLYPIETEEEWKLISDTFEEVKESCLEDDEEDDE